MLINKTENEKGMFSKAKYISLLCVFVSTSCLAKEWYLEPSFSLRTEYDDNKRLLTDTFVQSIRENGDNSKLSAYGIITSAEAKAGVRSDNYNVFFKGKVAIKEYFSDLDFDSEDFFLDLNADYTLNERNVLGFSAGYNQESTLTAELDATGLSQENIPRQTWSVSPTWTHYLSENKYIQTTYSHQDVSYKQSNTTRFSDYVYDSVTLTFFHQWNDKLQNFLTAGWSKFAVPVRRSETDEYQINAGLNYSFSETWTASAMAGVRFTHTEGFRTVANSSLVNTGLPINLPNGPIIINGVSGQVIDGLFFQDGIIIDQIPFTDDQTGLVFSFSTEKQFETGNIGGGYSRSTSPAGDGSLRTVDRFTLNYLQKITKHLHFDLNAAIHITEATSNVDLNSDRTYYTVTPSLRWQFNRQLSLSGGYRYRRQEFESVNNNAGVNNTKSVGESNSVFITLRYQWDKFSTQEF